MARFINSIRLERGQTGFLVSDATYSHVRGSEGGGPPHACETFESAVYKVAELMGIVVVSIEADDGNGPEHE